MLYRMPLFLTLIELYNSSMIRQLHHETFCENNTATVQPFMTTIQGTKIFLNGIEYTLESVKWFHYTFEFFPSLHQLLSYSSRYHLLSLYSWRILLKKQRGYPHCFLVVDYFDYGMVYDCNYSQNSLAYLSVRHNSLYLDITWYWLHYSWRFGGT